MPNQSTSASRDISVHSPAKVNLLLSVHGRRPDGFHELTSLMVALKFGDTLKIRISDSGEDTLICSNPEVPMDSNNLILKAAKAFRTRFDCVYYFEFKLEKRIPMGAGFGGGSGNAVAALSGMNQLLRNPLKKAALYELATELGSDCSFFVEAKPAWTYGRGERIEPLSVSLYDQLRGEPIVLFKPNFGVNTGWAYERLIANASSSYQPEPIETDLLEKSVKAGVFDVLLSNSFEAPVGKKYIALPTLLDQLRSMGVVCMMSGSGSGCFALPEQGNVCLEQIKEMVIDAWGENVFWVETLIC